MVARLAPRAPVDAEEAADPARRVYLVAVFGASAVVAIVTVLIIGYPALRVRPRRRRIAAGLVERIRAPLGLLSATAVVFGYHFAIWRRDRAAAADGRRRGRSSARVILVTAGDAGAVAGRSTPRPAPRCQLWPVATADARLGEADAPAVLASLDATSGAARL